MDTLRNSLQKLREYLSNTTLEEREKDWAFIKQITIEGPTVNEYYEELETQLTGYLDSYENLSSLGSFRDTHTFDFPSLESCDDIEYSSKFNQLFAHINMESRKIKIAETIEILDRPVSNFDTKTSGESNYALAA